MKAVSLVNFSGKRLEILTLADSWIQVEEGMLIHLWPGEDFGKVRLNMWIFVGKADEYTPVFFFFLKSPMQSMFSK